MLRFVLTFSMTFAIALASGMDNPCFKAGIGNTGNNYRAFDTDNPAECQSECLKENQCVVWVWNSEKLKCWLKDTIGELKLNSAAVSGTVSCAKGMDNPCFEYGIGNTGNNYRDFDTDNPTECQGECLKENQCVVWVWNSERLWCWLKDTIGELKLNSDAVSGTVSCAKDLDSNSDEEDVYDIDHLIEIVKVDYLIPKQSNLVLWGRGMGMGPDYIVKLKLKVNSIPTDEMTNIFQVTKGSKSGPFTRYPALYFYNNASLIFVSERNANTDMSNEFKNVVVGETYDIIIQQVLKSGKYMYEVFINGELVVSDENEVPITTREPQVYVSDAWHKPAPVEIHDFSIQTSKYPVESDLDFQETLRLDTVTAEQGKLVGILPVHGPEYIVEMKIKVADYNFYSRTNIFQITSGTGETYFGSSYPSIVLYTGYFLFYSERDGNSGAFDKYGGVQIGETYDIVIKNTVQDGTCMYEIFINGEQIVSHIHKYPIALYNAKVYVSSPWFEGAPFEVSDFVIMERNEKPFIMPDTPESGEDNQ